MIYDIIKTIDTIEKMEPITKGCSEDKKYCVETASGEKLMLRIADISEYDRKKAEYEMMERMDNIGVLTSRPVEFGLCDDGKSVYSLSGWLDGGDVHSILPTLGEIEQYQLGIKSGELLRKIHTLPAAKNAEPWGVRLRRMIKGNIEYYNTHDFKSPHTELIINYLNDNAEILDSRPQTAIHGDFWVANLIRLPNGEIAVIDFNNDIENYGDPWFELGMTFPLGGVEPFYAHFFTAMFRGHFGGDPPHEFYKILKYYYAFHALAAVRDIGEANGDDRNERISWFENIALRFNEFDEMGDFAPTWYLRNFHVEYVAGVPIKLKKPFDFSFLNKYGTVFKVVKHGEGSLNLCFGVENGDKKYFVKFAGAPNEMDASTDETIGFLKDAAQIYQDLAHESLIKLIKGEEVGGGYANIFEWVDAECIGYPSPPSRQKLLSLPIEAKLRAFDDILKFHAHVANQGYVAIDFYADQILYNFESGRTTICDIDFYQKSPYYGDKGTWGSANFVSPEEMIPGSRVDEITMVYTMGATAFSIFSDYDRSLEKWTIDERLYEVANRAVSDDRDMRQQSIREFMLEWKHGD